MPEILFEAPDHSVGESESKALLKGTVVKPSTWFYSEVPIYQGGDVGDRTRADDEGSGNADGEFPDPLEACALSESSNSDVRRARGSLEDRYASLLKRRNRMHSDATLMNELEKTRLDVILKQLEVEKTLQVCKFRRQEKRLRRSLELLEGYKEKLKFTLTERAQELQRRNEKHKYVLRGEHREPADGFGGDEASERTESQIRRARKTISQRHVDGLVKQVNLEFRLPPLEKDRLKMWTNPFDDGTKYERAKHIYGKPLTGNEENAGDKSKYHVTFLPELAVHPSSKRYIKFTKGFESGDKSLSSKNSPLKSCLKKADSEASLNNKIAEIAPSRTTDKSGGRDSLDEHRERNNASKSRVSFPSVRHAATREEAGRENWLRRVREVKKRHTGSNVNVGGAGARRVDPGLKIQPQSSSTSPRSHSLPNSESGNVTKLPALKTDME